MSNKELRLAIEHYINSNGVGRQVLYSNRIHPFFNYTIDNVFSSLGITEYERNDYLDLRQEALLKLITVILDNGTLNKIHNVRSYCFIIARNRIIDFIRKENTYGKFFELTNEFNDDYLENIY